MGRAVLSKSLIRFSVDGRGCGPSLLFDLRPSYGGGDEDNGGLLQKVPSTHCRTQYPRPCRRPLPTHASPGGSWTRASLGQSLVETLLLSAGPGVHEVLFVPLQESVSPVLCKFWQLYGGLMVTCSKRAYAIPRSAAPQAPACGSPLLTRNPQKTLTHTSGSVSVGLWVLVHTRFVCARQASLAGEGFASKHDFGLLPSC